MDRLATRLATRAPSRTDPTLDLEEGEREAISLAEELHADALLVDEQKARRLASTRGLFITGTLGIIKLASVRGLLDKDRALAALRATNFFIADRVIERVFGPDALQSEEIDGREDRES